MNWLTWHEKSERLASEAHLLLRQGQQRQAQILFSEAAEAENQALLLVSPAKSRTVGITAVSAISLWYKAGRLSTAKQEALKWLASGSLPPFAAEQLRSILEAIEGATSRAGSSPHSTPNFIPGAGSRITSGGAAVAIGGYAYEEHQILEDEPLEIAARWHRSVVLKRDIFSIVERGTYRGPDGDVDAVVRRIDQVPWWTFVFARNFLAREERALAVIGPLGIAPLLYFSGKRVLVRRWIDGVPLHIARPLGDRGYFRSARAVLRKLHTAGFCHNDLAKEQNWLRGTDGKAYLTDFQLSAQPSRRSRFFRLAAYEDLRHYLKHKRSYVPEALTATERRILARKTWLTLLWMATGKRVYIWVTRGLFRFTDREGGGPRLVTDAPQIAARLKTHPKVRDVVVLAFPDRRVGTGLYAFIEGKPGADEEAVHDFMVANIGRAKAPERMQLVEALPRHADGSVRIEILQLIAMNQLDQLDMLIANEAERRIVARIIADRRNLRDRFTF